MRAAPLLHPVATCTESAALRVEGLRRRYGAVEAVRGVSFEIQAGEVFGLLGPNGAGKTTTISLITTEHRPSAGDAYVFGYSVCTSAAAVRPLVGLVPQEVSLYPELTARENLWFFGRMYRVPSGELGRRVDELLELVGLEGRRDDRVSTFSGGMKRRLNLAAGLIHQPRLVLLDEPTVGVDPHSREHLFTLVRRLAATGHAVLYTTHYMEEAERLCDRLGIMDEGRIIAAGPLATLLTEAGCSEVVLVRGLPGGADLGDLRSAPGVLRIETREGLTRVFVHRAAHVLEPLQRLLARCPESVTIAMAPASLETLFLQLTGKELRD